MSRTTIRTAVTDYFTLADLQFVGKVYSARPEILPEAAYEANRMGEAVSSPNGSSAVLVVGIPSDERRRRADTGRGAVNDTHIYRIAMEVFFASTGGDAVTAQADYDVVVSAMIALVRANATLNTSGTVWSAGEYEQGIQHQQAEPYTDEEGLTVFIPGVVRFEAWEWVVGNV